MISRVVIWDQFVFEHRGDLCTRVIDCKITPIVPDEIKFMEPYKIPTKDRTVHLGLYGLVLV